MADLTGKFDPNAKPQADFEPLPAGTYIAQITESELRDTKKTTRDPRTGEQVPNGNYLYLKMEVLEGEHKGRLIFDRITMSNTNQKAVEIGNRQFASLRAAAGVPKPEDSAELHGIPIGVKVKVSNSEDYGPGNEVRNYIPAEDVPASDGAAAQDAPARPAAAPTAQKSRPWARKPAA